MVAAQIGWLGTAMLCYVTRKSTLHCPTKKDVRVGVTSIRCTYAADLAKGHPGAQVRDNASARHVTSSVERPVRPFNSLNAEPISGGTPI